MNKAVRFSCILISLLLISSNSYAATKAGAACTKFGSKSISGGKSYTCVKSGKKLVWDKGVLVPVAKPATNSTAQSSSQVTHSESMQFKPWDTQATAKEVNDAAQLEFRTWAAEQTKLNSNHRVLIQPGLLGSRVKNFQEADKIGSRIFAQFFKGEYATVMGSSKSWVIEQLNANGGKYQDCSFNAGNGGLDYCHDGGFTQGYVITTDMNFKAADPGVDGTALLAHEYFHAVQDQMSNMVGRQTTKEGQEFSKHLFPVWIQEGSANFVGFSVAALAMDTTYWAGREAMFKYAPPEPSINRNALKDYEIKSGPGNNSPTYPYITGQVACEFIVASVGFKRFLEIWTNFRVTQNFDQSFERAIGISIENFYEKFEKARLNLGLPEVTWKLICLTNYPINDVPSKLPPCRLNSANSGSSSTQDSSGSSSENRDGPPPVDRNANIEGLGCTPGDGIVKNSFGSFACTTLDNGNNLWKKTG